MATKSPSTNHDRKRRRFGQSADGGYSLPLVLVIAFVLIAGASALVARTGSGVFGSAFQKQSWEARSLAELGMATLVSRLNKEENRYLLAAPSNERVPSPSYRNELWSSDSAVLAANHTNPCADTYITDPNTELQIKQPTPPEIGNIYPNKQRDGWWYVNSSGEVSTNATNAVGKFRLIGNKDGNPILNFRMGIVKYVNNGDVEEELNFSQPNGKSSIKLSVEAIALNADGSDKDRAILEEVLDIVPKCCKTTFGNDHGSNYYRSSYSADNPFGNGACAPQLDPDSFGIAYGTGGQGGTLKTIGNATEVWKRNEDGSKELINPVACVQTSDKPCVIDGTFNGISGSNVDQLLEVLATSLPPAPVWLPGQTNSVSLPKPYLPLAATGTSGTPSLSVCSGKPNNSGNDCRLVSESEAATTPYFRYCIGVDETTKDCKRTVINGNASPIYLPEQCRFSSPPPNGDGALHCVVSRLNLGNNGTLQFATGILPAGASDPTIRPIRIYFAEPSASSSDYLIEQGGSALVEHCVLATADLPSNSSDLSDPRVRRCRGLDTSYREKVTLLSMFGCNPESTYYGKACSPPAGVSEPKGAQYFKLQGNASSLGYFNYFPYGNIELQGNADVEGVIWASNLQVGGSGDFIVPSSGVVDVFELMGINPGDNNDFSGSISGKAEEPWQPKWDFVARSTRRFRFKLG